MRGILTGDFHVLGTMRYPAYAGGRGTSCEYVLGRPHTCLNKMKDARGWGPESGRNGHKVAPSRSPRPDGLCSTVLARPEAKKRVDAQETGGSGHSLFHGRCVAGARVIGQCFLIQGKKKAQLLAGLSLFQIGGLLFRGLL